MMRGSVYYQATVLTKMIFAHGAKKSSKTDPNSTNYQCVSSFNAMKTYRSVWENLFNYLKEHFGVKNFELIGSDHIRYYLEYKIEYYPTRQYLEKLVSAIGKLEVALNRYSKTKYSIESQITYDFSIRNELLNSARDLNLVANNYHNRVYENPHLIIESLSDQMHKLAATIQLEGGARSEGVTLIKPDQLKGKRLDKITNKEVGAIETKEKGGKVGDVQISPKTYDQLEGWFDDNRYKNFRIKYQDYIDDIKDGCARLDLPYHASHGFRWTFAQNRVRECQLNGFSYEQALQQVSWEMKHFRASITEHYLGG